MDINDLMERYGLLGGTVTDADRRNALNLGLMQAGLGILANAAAQGYRPPLGQALGSGGAAGLVTYQRALENAAQNRLRNSISAMQLAEFEEKRKRAEAMARMQWRTPKAQYLASIGDYKGAVEADFKEPKYKIEKNERGEFVYVPEAPGEGEITTTGVRGYNEALDPMAREAKIQDRVTMEMLLDPLMRARAAASAPMVNVRTEVKSGEALAAKVGDIAEKAQAQADSAIQQIMNNNRVLEALDRGIVAGPTAGARIRMMQLADIVGALGKDDKERLINTRKVVQGLAESTLASRGLLAGQGAISEFEQKTLEKARSGDIDNMTADELKAVFGVFNRIASAQYRQAAERLSEVQKNPNYQAIAPFYKIPELPSAYGQAGQEAQGRVTVRRVR